VIARFIGIGLLAEADACVQPRHDESGAGALAGSGMLSGKPDRPFGLLIPRFLVDWTLSAEDLIEHDKLARFFRVGLPG
jgi:hypothetical protein